jgi:hypothetical protein
VPHEGKYWSRVDLPFPDAAGHIASHARANTPEESLHRAIAGAIACGEEIDSDLVDRARQVGIMLLGDLDSIDGDSEIGNFFGKLLKKAVPFATSFIPGVGPLASAASKAAMSAVSKKGKKKPPPAQRRAAPPPKTAVRALAKGGGQPQPTPDTITHEPSGAVSVPIATPPPPGTPAGAPSAPAMLFYHPSNSASPVVMRF